MIKKIRVWKVILLSLITFGIYTFVWFALRRNEMVKKYKVSMPHWHWLFTPSIVFLSLFVLFILFSPTDASGNVNSNSLLFFVLLGLITIIWIAATCISFWWMWQFGKASEKITNGKITLGWILAYLVVLGPVIIPVLQYYFNRVPKKASITSKKVSPSKKFVMRSIAVMAAVLVFMSLGGAWLAAKGNDPTQPFYTTKELNSMADKADALAKEFDKCVKQLDKDYPADIDPSDRHKYNEAYDRCDAIRVDQNKAADEYNKAIGN